MQQPGYPRIVRRPTYWVYLARPNETADFNVFGVSDGTQTKQEFIESVRSGPNPPSEGFLCEIAPRATVVNMCGAAWQRWQEKLKIDVLQQQETPDHQEGGASEEGYRWFLIGDVSNTINSRTDYLEASGPFQDRYTAESATRVTFPWRFNFEGFYTNFGWKDGRHVRWVVIREDLLPQFPGYSDAVQQIPQSLPVN